jgi:hypothetical protein
VTATVDLFEPPAHITYLAKYLAAAQESPGTGLRKLATRVGIGFMTVRLARDYHRLMQAAGTSDAYRELTECPTKASRWRGRGRDDPPADVGS